MTKQEFSTLLTKATNTAIEVAKEYIINELPPSIQYHVYLNQSYDLHSNGESFDSCPLDEDKAQYYLSTVEVIALLYRKGKLPVWIDICVSKTIEHKTIIKLLCAGRFTNQENQYYYHNRDMGPFGIKSPDESCRIIKNGKFDINISTPPTH